MKVDKNKAVIQFLSDCPVIKDNPLFFNFGDVKNNDCQYITSSEDTSYDRKFIDGSVMKVFTFTLITLRSVSENEIVKEENPLSENIDDMFELQDIIDWVNDQADDMVFPNFGSNIIIDNMRTTTNTPKFEGVDTGVSPALALYSMAIRIEYIDYTKTIWS